MTDSPMYATAEPRKVLRPFTTCVTCGRLLRRGYAGGGVTAGGPVLVRAGAGLRPPVVRAAAPG